MKHKKGFTLIELLIVIAIIAVLAALVLPALLLAKEKSNQASCMNNLKQIGIAYQIYAQDFSDYLPPTLYNAFGRNCQLWSDPSYGTLGLLAQGYTTGHAKYITNPGVLFCPSNASVGTDFSVAAFNANFEIAGGAVYSSYSVNGNNSSTPVNSLPEIDGPYFSGGSRLSVSAMKGYPCAADGFMDWASYGQWFNHLWNGKILGFNVLYFDGSVKWWNNIITVAHPYGVLYDTGDPEPKLPRTTSYGNQYTGVTDTFWWAVRQQ